MLFMEFSVHKYQPSVGRLDWAIANVIMTVTLMSHA